MGMLKALWFNIRQQYSTVGFTNHEALHSIGMHINGKYYIMTEFRDMCFYDEDKENIDTLEEAKQLLLQTAKED